MNFTVRDFYNNKIITLNKDANMVEARRLLRNFRNSLVAIIDESSHIHLEPSEILGIVSTQEILYCDDFNAPVEKYMSKDQRIVDIESPLLKTVNAMIYEQQNFYLVRDGNYIVGFLGHDELVAGLQKVMQHEDHENTWGLQTLLNPLLPRTGYF